MISIRHIYPLIWLSARSLCAWAGDDEVVWANGTSKNHNAYRGQEGGTGAVPGRSGMGGAFDIHVARACEVIPNHFLLRRPQYGPNQPLTAI
jgi:hypothetical protein